MNTFDPWGIYANQKLDRILTFLTRLENEMSAAFQALQASLTTLSSLVSQVISLYQQALANADDPAAIAALTAQVNGLISSLQAIIPPTPPA